MDMRASPRSARAPAPGIAIDHEAVGALCRRRGIARLALFGSVLRSDFGPESDVDVMVDLGSPDARPRGWRYFGLGDEVAAVLCPGRRVDLSERPLLRPLVRAEADAESYTVYGAP